MTMNEEIKNTEDTINEQEMTMAELIAQQESLSEKLYKKEIVEVPVVQINQDYILVDTGAKKEGAIAVAEFEGKTLPAVGDTISAVLVKRGSDERPSILSHKKPWNIWVGTSAKSLRSQRTRKRYDCTVRKGRLHCGSVRRERFYAAFLVWTPHGL